MAEFRSTSLEEGVKSLSVSEKLDEKNRLSNKLSSLGSGLRFKSLTSKYALKEKSYFDLKPCKVQNDGYEIACSELFWATAYVGGGGPCYVSRIDNLGRIEQDCTLINGHSSAVSDIAFSPFHPTLMTTASVDCTVKLWRLPQDGPLRNLSASDAKATLTGFNNSVRSTIFHPTCDHILACSGLDKAVSFYDLETTNRLCSFDLNVACKGSAEVPAISNLSFNFDGSAYALACKDKCVRIVDPRLPTEGAIVGQTAADGPLGRNLRVEWCSNGSNACSTLLTVSSSSTGMRSIHLFDPRQLTAPLCSRTIDTAAGQLYPMYDPCLGLCFIAGKGDSTIRAYELSLQLGEKDCMALCEKAAEFPAPDRTTCTGICKLPISSCDIRNIECARLLKMTTTAVVPISVSLARSESLKQYFQDDIYGPVYSRTTHHSAERFRQWLVAPANTVNIEPSLESLQPSDLPKLSEKPVEAPKASKASSFRAAKEAEERELREKEEHMARLTAMANVNASYNKNKSMGDNEVDSDDNWGDD